MYSLPQSMIEFHFNHKFSFSYGIKASFLDASISRVSQINFGNFLIFSSTIIIFFKLSSSTIVVFYKLFKLF